jgi:hypothetical protein
VDSCSLTSSFFGGLGFGGGGGGKVAKVMTIHVRRLNEI